MAAVLVLAASTTEQLVQVAGALLILAAFAAAQFGVMSVKSPLYLVLNFAGAAILFWLALIEELWGFVLLEFVWALVALWGLVQVMRGREPAGAEH